MLEVVWAHWDWVKWLTEQDNVFLRKLENWTKREDTVHQIRVTSSFADKTAEDERR